MEGQLQTSLHRVAEATPQSTSNIFIPSLKLCSVRVNSGSERMSTFAACCLAHKPLVPPASHVENRSAYL